MPINPDLQLRSVTPETIADDRTCVACGYALRGLKVTGVCPECGKPIKGRKRAPRYSDQLVQAPIEWLEVFAAGAVLLLLSASGIVAMTITLLFVRNTALLLVLTGLCACWTLGVWLTTRPRPVMPATTVDTTREWRGLRQAARVSQCFWPGTCLLALLSIWAYNAATSPLIFYGFVVLTGLSLLVAIGGLTPTCALLAHMADWAEDSSLAQAFRGCAWTVCFSGVVIGLAILNGYTGIFGAVIGALLATAIILLVFTPPVYFLVTLFRLQHMARWAVWNHVAAEAKLDRFRARAESASHMPRPQSRPPAKSRPTHPPHSTRPARPRPE